MDPSLKSNSRSTLKNLLPALAFALTLTTLSSAEVTLTPGGVTYRVASDHSSGPIASSTQEASAPDWAALFVYSSPLIEGRSLAQNETPYTPTPTATHTPTYTPTFTPSFTPTSTPTATFTPTATPLPPDLNGDRLINTNDLLLLIGGFKPQAEGHDLNNDGRRDYGDLFYFAPYWDTTLPSP